MLPFSMETRGWKVSAWSGHFCFQRHAYMLTEEFGCVGLAVSCGFGGGNVEICCHVKHFCGFVVTSNF